MYLLTPRLAETEHIRLQAYYDSPAFREYEQAYDRTERAEQAYENELANAYHRHAVDARHDRRRNQATPELKRLRAAVEEEAGETRKLLRKLKSTDEHAAVFGWKLEPERHTPQLQGSAQARSHDYRAEPPIGVTDTISPTVEAFMIVFIIYTFFVAVAHAVMTLF